MVEEENISGPRLDADPRVSGAEAISPPADDLFDALADRTRRRVLWFLLEESRSTREELADVLLGGELSEEGVAGPDDRDHVLAMLHHVHLPKLVDAGLVVREGDGEVRLAPMSDPVHDLVRFGHRYGREAGARASE